ncbi:MAG: PLP-dependent aminotransferase family protein [Lachnospiraceae bacterium]|nr:PLP-dependent aminotransferase family protein [Lachnospiraceae bacterium]
MLTYDLAERGSRTMYEFLYEKMKEDIMQGVLKTGEKLPSKRAMAEHMDVSIKTVENAYNQLLLEGYITSAEKKGYFVSKLSKGGHGTTVYEGFTTKYKEEQVLADFTAHNINYDKFPFASWAKVMRETLTDYDTSLLKMVPFNGVEELRIQIAEYLYRYRGMQVSPDNIIIGAGTEYLYGRLLQLLGKDAFYAVENPGYKKISRLYEANGVKWTYIDIDKRGMNVDALRASGASVAHVSPEHHYPVGIVTPIGRRQELLAWAAEEMGRYIIEDDYDCEFRLVGRAIPSLQSMDANHRVIYMNNFSKTMVPSLRVSYMVLPEKLMERYLSTMSFYSCSVSGFEQYALARFMEKGYFERHIRRSIHYYKQQRDKICSMFRASSLNKISRIIETGAGTHFLLRVDTDLSDVEIKWAAKERGVLIQCLSEYCFENQHLYKGFLIINYSDMEEERLKKAIRELEELLGVE